MLDTVFKAFPHVFIDSSPADEAAALVEHHNYTTEVLQVIDAIRDSVRKAQSAGKIVYGPQRSRKPDDDDGDDNSEGGTFESSTLNLVANLAQAEIAVVDDRGLNKEPFVLDSRGHRARTVTSLDMIEELHSRQLLTDDERRALRHRLRVAGACLVPLDTEEIVVAALRSTGLESAELRAMKESILLARVAGLPRFPSEIPWFATTTIAIKNAIMAVWTREPDHTRPAVLADAILNLQAHPEDWVDQWDGQVPPNWVQAVSLALVAGLALPVELQDEKLTQAYNLWVERNVLEPLRSRAPETYIAVVEHIRSFINSVAEDDMTEKKIVVSKRVRAIFALDKLSDRLQTDVLKHPATAKLWDIKTTRTMKLAADLTVQWKGLFSIFQAAADGKPIPPLLDEKNREHAVKATIDPQGAGLLEVGKYRFRFSHAVLMSGSPEKRCREIERIFGSVTIHSGLQGELSRIVGGSEYWVDEFMMVAEALSSSPEEFETRLSEKASTGKVALSDVLPDDHSHWDNLTAPITASGTLADFIANELTAERAARVARNPVVAFRSIALTFSAPALVPFDLFRPLNKETKRRLLEETLLLDDHFSLVGAFELCADWIGDDPDFADAGERLCDRLFGDLKRLETACGMFGAALVLSVAQIAEDDKLNIKPAFWRRLAAASHALLVVRACGVTEIEHKDLIAWSMTQSGQAYFLSVLCDFRTDPQWRPEWIDPRFLLADVCGRAIGAWAKIPKEKTPASWTERIDKLRTWISENHCELLTTYPAVMEGARRPALPVVSLSELYKMLMREPSVDHLLRMTPAIQAFGPPREITESLHKVIGIIRADSSADEEGNLTNAIKLLSHVAALLQDTNLANPVAEACIERLAMDERRESVIETIYRLLECSAAETDKAAARLFLSRKLEQVCYTVTKPELLAEIAAWIEELKLISPELKCGLGRALAVAKLGASGPAAA